MSPGSGGLTAPVTGTSKAGAVRVLLALLAVALLLGGSASPHHHAAPGASHECAACTVGSGLEARLATPVPAPRSLEVAREVARPAAAPVAGAPLGAVPGQSPPRA